MANIGHKEKFKLNPGTKFHRLTIISFHGQREIGKEKRKFPYYNCLCDCGKIKVIMKDSLIKGNTKSCGCLQKEATSTGDKRRLPDDKAAFNNYFYSYKRSAKKRKLDFNLTEEQFKFFTKNNCYYCNKPADREHLNRINKTITVPYLCNGIDRIDSNKGYFLENIRTCCFSCNKAKSDLTEEEFYSMIKNIYELRIKYEL